MEYPTNHLNLLLKILSSKTNLGWGYMESEVSNLPLLKYLEDHGVTLNDLIDTALELFVPHPGVETREKAVEMFKAGSLRHYQT
jgi:hypothetical protein